MCDFKDLRRLRRIGPQPRAGSGLQDRPPPACPILVGWVPTATAAKFFRASYWNSSLKQALSGKRHGRVPCVRLSNPRPSLAEDLKKAGQIVSRGLQVTNPVRLQRDHRPAGRSRDGTPRVLAPVPAPTQHMPLIRIDHLAALGR